jgi:DNA replication protein DnaC
MRDEKNWIERTRPSYIKMYLPRIQKALQEIEEPEDIPEIIESYYIHSSVGYGKTILAAQMMLKEQKRIWTNDGPRDNSEKCLFVSTPTLFQEIKNTYNKNSDIPEQQVIDKYNECHLLVLDDFGTSKPTDFVLQTLYLIINHRYDYLKKIILTSNLTLGEVAELFGDDRIISRIERMCEIIEKQDWRKKK